MLGRSSSPSTREVLEDWSKSLSPSALQARLSSEYFISLLPQNELETGAFEYDYKRRNDDLVKVSKIVASREELAAVGAANQEAKDRVKESLQVALAHASGTSYYHELHEKRLAVMRLFAALKTAKTAQEDAAWKPRLAHRVTVPTAAESLSDQFIQSLLQVNPAASCDEFVLVGLHNQLTRLEPAALFEQWANLGHQFTEQLVELTSDDVVQVDASPPQYSNLGALRVLQPDRHYWGSKPKTEPTFWSLQLREPVALSSLLLHWHKTAVPDEVEVLIACAEAQVAGPADAASVMRVPLQVDDQNRCALTLPNVLRTSHIVLQFHGFGRENSKQQHKLEMVELFTPATHSESGGADQFLPPLPLNILGWLRDAHQLSSFPQIDFSDARASWLLACMVDVSSTIASGRLVLEILNGLVRATHESTALSPHLTQSVQHLVQQIKLVANAQRPPEGDALFPRRLLRATFQIGLQQEQPPDGQPKRFVYLDAGATLKCTASSAADDTVFIPVQLRNGKGSWEFQVLGPSAHLISYGLADGFTPAGIRRSAHALLVSGSGGSAFAENDRHAAEILKPLPRLNSGDRVRLHIDVEMGHLSVGVNGVDLGVVLKSVPCSMSPAFRFSKEVNDGTQLRIIDGVICVEQDDTIDYAVDCADFGPLAFKTSLATEGRRGRTEAVKTHVVEVDGRYCPHALSVHPCRPPPGQPASPTVAKQSYRFVRQPQHTFFCSTVALADLIEPDAGPARFSVLLDDEVVWQSDWLNKAGMREVANVALEACVEIELRVEYYNTHAAFDAVWVDPRFTRSIPHRSLHAHSVDMAQALRRLLDASANQVHVFKASSVVACGEPLCRCGYPKACSFHDADEIVEIISSKTECAVVDRHSLDVDTNATQDVVFALVQVIHQLAVLHLQPGSQLAINQSLHVPFCVELSTEGLDAFLMLADTVLTTRERSGVESTSDDQLDQLISCIVQLVRLHLHQLHRAFRLRQSLGPGAEQELLQTSWRQQVSKALAQVPAIHNVIKRLVQLQLPGALATELAASLWDTQAIFRQEGQAAGVALFQSLNLTSNEIAPDSDFTRLYFQRLAEPRHSELLRTAIIEAPDQLDFLLRAAFEPRANESITIFHDLLIAAAFAVLRAPVSAKEPTTQGAHQTSFVEFSRRVLAYGLRYVQALAEKPTERLTDAAQSLRILQLLQVICTGLGLSTSSLTTSEQMLPSLLALSSAIGKAVQMRTDATLSEWMLDLHTRLTVEAAKQQTPSVFRQSGFPANATGMPPANSEPTMISFHQRWHGSLRFRTRSRRAVESVHRAQYAIALVQLPRELRFLDRGVHHFWFRVLACMSPPEEAGMAIGVIDAQENPDSINFEEFARSSMRCWFYSCQGMLVSSEIAGHAPYGTPLTAGADVVMGIYFDPSGNGASIRFTVNGVDQGIAFSGLRGVRLIPGVWLYGRADAIELRGYQGSGSPSRQAVQSRWDFFREEEDAEDSDGDDDSTADLLFANNDHRNTARFAPRSGAPPMPPPPAAPIPPTSRAVSSAGSPVPGASPTHAAFPADVLPQQGYRRSQFINATADHVLTRSHGAQGQWKLAMVGGPVSSLSADGVVHRWSVRISCLQQPSQLWVGFARGDVAVDCPMRDGNFGWGVFGDGCLGTLSCDDRAPYCPQLYEGDTVEVQFDSAQRTLQFDVNGQSFGNAFSPPLSVSYTPAWAPDAHGELFLAIALRNSQDSVRVAPAGMMGTSICMPALLDLHKLVVTTAARMAGTLTSGLPLLPVEEQLQPWLETPLLLSSYIGESQPAKLTDFLQRQVDQTTSTPASEPLPTTTIRVPNLLAVPDEFTASGPYGASWQAVNARMNKLCKASYTIVFNRLMVFSQIISVDIELLFFAALAHQASALQELRILLQNPEVDSVSSTIMEIWLGLISFRRWLKQQQQTLVDSSAGELPPATVHGDGESALLEGEQPEDSVGQSEASHLLESKTEEHQQETKQPEDHDQSFNRVYFLTGVKGPASFEELKQDVTERLRFLLSSVCVPTPCEDGDDLQKDEHDQDQDTPEPLPDEAIPLMRSQSHSTGPASSTNPDADKGWRNMLHVLQAQHEWMRSRGFAAGESALSGHSDAEAYASSITGLDTLPYGVGAASRLRMFERLILHAAFCYITDGYSAPPTTLLSVIHRRATRAHQRLLGLSAFGWLLDSTSALGDAYLMDCLVPFRPALRGGRAAHAYQLAADAANPADDAALAATDDATANITPSTVFADLSNKRHHYLLNIDGAGQIILGVVQKKMHSIFNHLLEKLASAVQRQATTAVAMILWSLCLDFFPEDLEYLASKGLHKLVHSLHSVNAQLHSVTADKNAFLRIATPMRVGKGLQRAIKSSSDRSSAWKPWTPSEVSELVKQGKLPVRRVLLHMLTAPAHLQARDWWASHLDVLDWELDDVGIKSTLGKRVSAFLSSYSSFVEHVNAANTNLGTEQTALQDGSVPSGRYAYLLKGQAMVEFQLPAATSRSFTVECWLNVDGIADTQQLFSTTDDKGTEQFSVRLVGGKVRTTFGRHSCTFRYRVHPRVWTHLAFGLQITKPTWSSAPTAETAGDRYQICLTLYAQGAEVERDYFTATTEPKITKCSIGSKNDRVHGLQGYVAHFTAHSELRSPDQLAFKKRPQVRTEAAGGVLESKEEETKIEIAAALSEEKDEEVFASRSVCWPLRDGNPRSTTDVAEAARLHNVVHIPCDALCPVDTPDASDRWATMVLVVVLARRLLKTYRARSKNAERSAKKTRQAVPAQAQRLQDALVSLREGVITPTTAAQQRLLANIAQPFVQYLTDLSDGGALARVAGYSSASTLSTWQLVKRRTENAEGLRVEPLNPIRRHVSETEAPLSLADEIQQVHKLLAPLAFSNTGWVVHSPPALLRAHAISPHIASPTNTLTTLAQLTLADLMQLDIALAKQQASSLPTELLPLVKSQSEPLPVAGQAHQEQRSASGLEWLEVENLLESAMRDLLLQGHATFEALLSKGTNFVRFIATLLSSRIRTSVKTMCLRLLRTLVSAQIFSPASACACDDVWTVTSKSLASTSTTPQLAHWLLEQVGQVFHGRGTGLNAEQSQENAAVGLGYMQECFALECVALLRSMLNAQEWQPTLAECFTSFLACEAKAEVPTEQAPLATAVLCVLGGAQEVIRAGGAVEVEVTAELAKNTTIAGTATKRNGFVRATVTNHVPGHDTILLAFENGSNATALKRSLATAVDPVVLSPETTNALPELCSAYCSFLERCLQHSSKESSPGGIAKLVQCQWLAMAVKCFPTLLSGISESAIYGGLFAKLYKVALRTVSLPTFHSVQAFELRRVVLQRMLTESNFDELRKSGLTSVVHKTRSHHEEVEEAKRESRKVLAADLAALGFDMRMCVKALELNDDQPDRAAEWLFMGQGEAYAAMGDQMTGGQQEDGEYPDKERSKVAAELVPFVQLPPKLCYQALEMCNDVRQDAVDWLLNHGRKYLEFTMSEDNTAIPVVIPSFSPGSVPLGVESGLIDDSQLTCSTAFGAQHEAKFARLNLTTGSGGWCAGANNTTQYLQVDLGGVTRVTGVAVQGRASKAEVGPGSGHKVTSFLVLCSNDGMEWSEIRPANRQGESNTFVSESNCDVAVNFPFATASTTRYVRFVPQAWHGHIAMRVEVFGQRSGKPLGIWDDSLPSSHLSTSSSRTDASPAHGRLTSALGLGGWAPRTDDQSPYLQVDMGGIWSVTHVATQGAHGLEDSWTTAYRLTFSEDGVQWRDGPTFVGNQNSSSVVLNAIDNPTSTRFVRFHPTEWYRIPSMRVEVFVQWPGVELTAGLPDTCFTASSVVATPFAPGNCRAGFVGIAPVGAGGWCPSGDDITPYLTVDLLQDCAVSAILVQGQDAAVGVSVPSLSGYGLHDASARWLKSYRLQSSVDGRTWSNVQPANDKGAVDFVGCSDSSTFSLCHFNSSITARFFRILPQGYEGAPVLRMKLFGASPGVPLGLQSESIADDQITCTSASTDGPARCCRLHGFGAWRPSALDLSDTITIKLKALAKIGGFALQGGCQEGDTPAGWVTAFSVSYSEDGSRWTRVLTQEGVDIFDGASCPEIPITHILPEPVYARFVRFQPLSWVGSCAMRLELYGQGIERSLGLESGAIADSQLSASSTAAPTTAAQHARLLNTNHGGCWSPNPADTRPYLQIDMKGRRCIVAVSTQGKAGEDQNAYVTSYTVAYSNSGTAWSPVLQHGSPQVFTGNSDNNTALINYLPSPIFARFVRIQPQSYQGSVAMRAELYGSSAGQSDLENDDATFEAASGDVSDSTRLAPRHSASNPAYKEEPLAYLVALATPVPQGGEPANHQNNSESTVQPEVGMFVTDTSAIGSVSEFDGAVGTVVEIMEGNQARLRLLDFNTGIAYEDTTRPLSVLRARTAVFGRAIEDVCALEQFMCEACEALTVHYTRQAILSLLTAKHEASQMLDASGRQAETLTPEVVGEPRVFMELFKLMLASTNALSSGLSEHTGKQTGKAAAGGGQLWSTMRSIMRDVLKTESHGNSNNVASSVSSFAKMLVDECTWNFIEGTRPPDTRTSQARESLHPYFPRCKYRHEVRVEGATALRVVFDPRCRTLPDATLTLAYDKDMSRVISKCSGGPASFKPILVNGDHFYYGFQAAVNPDIPDTSWGWRFTVTPLTGLQWMNELQVNKEPCLQWACCLLEFLLTETDEAVLANGAVHNNDVFEALVKYMRTPGVPFKQHVVSLLTRLLQTPNLFPPGEPPTYSLLDGIRSLAEDHCASLDSEQAASSLPPHIQAVVELVTTSSIAQRNARAVAAVKPHASSEATENPEALVEQENSDLQFTLPPPIDATPPLECLVDLIELSQALVSDDAAPDQLLSEAYFDAVGIQQAIDGHVLLTNAASETVAGMLRFPGAKQLQVRLVLDDQAIAPSAELLMTNSSELLQQCRENKEEMGVLESKDNASEVVDELKESSHGEDQATIEREHAASAEPDGSELRETAEGSPHESGENGDSPPLRVVVDLPAAETDGNEADVEDTNGHSVGGVDTGNDEEDDMGVTSDLVDLLVGMGIDTTAAQAALWRCQNDVEVAIDMCFENDMDEIVRQFQQERSARRESRRQTNSVASSPTRDPPARTPTSATHGSGAQPTIPLVEDPETAKQKAEWQKRFENVTYSVLLSEHLAISIHHQDSGFIAFPSAAGQPLTFMDDPNARCGIRLSRDTAKVESESSDESDYWVLQSTESTDSAIGINNEGGLQRVTSNPAAFAVELRDDGKCLLLRNQDRHYVRVRDGKLVCDVPGNALEQNPALLRSCMFESLVRTAPEENDGNRAFVAGHHMTQAHPGRPLGLSSGLITDSQLTASSANLSVPAEWSCTNARYKPWQQNSRGGWLAGAHNAAQWLQIDLQEPTQITGLTIQAPNYEAVWTREFKLSVSNDGQTWATVQHKSTTLFFPANSHPTIPTTIVFDTPIECRFVRVCPTKWNQSIGLRLELHGLHCYRISASDTIERLQKMGTIDIPGDTLHYLFSTGAQTLSDNSDDSAPAPIQTRLGMKLVVTAVGLTRKQIADWLNSNPNAIKDELKGMSRWTAKMDHELVSVLNTRLSDAMEKSEPTHFEPADLYLTTNEKLQLQLINSMPAELIQIRFALLRNMNLRLGKVLPLVDLSTSLPWRAGFWMRKLGYCILYELKLTLLDESMTASASFGGAASLSLDHQQKLTSTDQGDVDPAVSRCLFVQAFEQLRDRPSESLRLTEAGGRVFSVNFVNEAGIDAGGVYRDAINEIVEDLHSADFSLFVPCPNAVHMISTNTDKFLPNPKHTSPLALEMLEFVGKLMGISLRTKATLPFNFPSFVYKGLLGQPIEITDLEGTDAVTVQCLKAITEESKMMDQEQFETAFGGTMTFTIADINGETHELIAGGANVPVTFENRYDYVRRVEQFKLHEIDRQLQAMRQGLSGMAPMKILELFTWQQLEVLIAGEPSIDLNYLREHTEYRGYKPTDTVIAHFWEVMTGFDSQERSKFIRFVWGRSRLPLRGKTWPQSFKIQKCHDASSDMLPVTHTCFFSIELPEYPTVEVMRERLLTAINFGVGGILNG